MCVYKKQWIDRILNAWDHTALRLLPYNCKLSTNEAASAKVKVLSDPIMWEWRSL